MAEYVFERGRFGVYNVPMWAGETRALKLVKMLVKQGYSNIKYEESDLVQWNENDLVTSRRKRDGSGDIIKQNGIAPRTFKVTFEGVKCR